MIQVFLIDDHPMVIEGVKALLQGSTVAAIAGSANDGYAALDLLQRIPAEVALVDINLPDLDGIELCKMLKVKFPKLKILGLSTFKERSYISKMMEAGASGYLLKNATRDEIEDAVVAAQKGRVFMSMEVAEMLAKSPPVNHSALPLLTSREKEVLTLIAEGMTNNAIAEKLFISPLTVDSHRKNLLAKFGVKNTAAMVKFAFENGLL